MTRAGTRDTSAEVIKVCCNELAKLDAELLPRTTRSLEVMGNALVTLPDALQRLPQLESIVAGANNIKNADVIFCCPELVHASLPFNKLSSITCSSTSVCTASRASQPDCRLAIRRTCSESLMYRVGTRLDTFPDHRRPGSAHTRPPSALKLMLQ